MWIFCLIASLLLLLTGVTLAILSHARRWRHVRPSFLPTLCTFLSAVFAFFPLYRTYFADSYRTPLRSVLLSFHNAIRLFVIDCDFDFVRDLLAEGVSADVFRSLYAAFFSVLYILCPILTFGFVLSFFKNVSAYRRLLFTFGRDLYVFSELNQKNLSLAKSLKAGDPRRVVIFTDVDDGEEATDDALLDDAYALGAILFKAEIASIGIPSRSPRNKIAFIVQGDDADKNLSYALALTESRKNANHNETLYFFDTTAIGDAVFANPRKRNLVVRHIDPHRALIYDSLYHDGIRLFETAATADESGERLIKVLIVGLGDYGAEMFKALTWMCQMNGYRLEIVGLDADEAIVSRFRSACPGLFDPAVNGQRRLGDAQFTIELYGGIDALTSDLEDAVRDHATDATYILVSLGDDDRNVAVSYRLREIYERLRAHSGLSQDSGIPYIDTIVYDPDIARELREARNHKGFSQRICYFGSLDTYFCESVFFNSEAEAAALAVNAAYGGTEEDFYYCDYNYSSSLASGIHKKLRRDCHMPGTDRPVSERTQEEMEQLAILEHRRWCAYIRSEGYQHGGTEASRKVDTVAKMHYCLIPYDCLSEEEKRKDYVVL